MWLQWLLGRPKTEFRGDPIWYRHLGDEPCGLDGALSIDGGPLRRDLDPGEVFRFRGWRLINHGGFQRIERGFFGKETPTGGETTTDDVTAPTHRPWVEIKQMGIKAARAYLLTLGIRGRGWKELELEYEGHCLGDD